MSTILFDKLVFGPVYSRRLGVSLGINLLPVNSKYCNFNCIYCECGWTENNHGKKLVLPDRLDIRHALEAKLKELNGTVNEPDAITFAGNGEPTIHPDFEAIIDDTIKVRNQYAPKSLISVLSNASMLHKASVRRGLGRVDRNILKLDTGTETTFQLLNQHAGNLTVKKIVDHLMLFEGNLIIQTLFVRGQFNGHYVDNTSEIELAAWLPLIKKINPQFVMIYPIDRGTPLKGLEKVSKEELLKISERLEKEGIRSEVYF